MTSALGSYQSRLAKTYEELQLDKLPHSILWGKPGKYTYFGIEITFKNPQPFQPSGSVLDNILKVYRYYGKFIIDALCQRHFYVLMHEAGHALAAKCLTRINPRIEIDNPPDYGICAITEPEINRWEIVNNIIIAAGPLTGAALAATQMVRAAGYKDLSPTLMFLLSAGGLAQMLADFAYLITSGLRCDNGDWGQLAKSNISHFWIAAFMMMSLYALSLFMSYMIIS